LIWINIPLRPAVGIVVTIKAADPMHPAIGHDNIDNGNILLRRTTSA
jgi:hypothetical protein